MGMVSGRIEEGYRGLREWGGRGFGGLGRGLRWRSRGLLLFFSWGLLMLRV